jgi:hypothetical protein
MKPKQISFAPVLPETIYHHISGSLINKESKLFFFNRVSISENKNVILYDLPVYEMRSICKYVVASHTIKNIFDVENHGEIFILTESGEQLTFLTQERCDNFLSQLFQIDPTS